MFALGRLGASFGKLGSAGSGIIIEAIRLSNSDVREDAAVGATIGNFSISGEYTGTPVWSLADDASGLFSVTGSALKVAATLDFETAAFHTIVASVSGIDPAIADTPFTITVLDITEEGPVVSYGALVAAILEDI